MVRLIDSTTIDLNRNQFEWAKFRSTKAGVKLHTVYDPNAEVPVYFEMTHAKVNDRKALVSLPMLPGVTYVVDRAYNDYGWYYSLDKVGSTFVGRMKTKARYEVIDSRATQSDQVLSDEVIRLNSDKAKMDCPIPLRRIVFERPEDKKVLVFISNDLDRSAEEIAVLYKQRWQLELFFKWIKQNLKIKQFFGRSENAVMIQILVAMMAYLLLKLTQLGNRYEFSLQKIARVLSLNLTARRTIEGLFHPDTDRDRRTHQNTPQLELEISYV